MKKFLNQKLKKIQFSENVQEIEIGDKSCSHVSSFE